MKKPKTCAGCVLYGDGEGFVPDTIVDGARVVIVDGSPSRNDVETSTPFSGYGGRDAEHRFFKYAGLTRDAVSFMHVLRCSTEHVTRPTVIADAATTCRQFDVQQTPELVILVGDIATTYVAGVDGKSEEWRGRCLELG